MKRKRILSGIRQPDADYPVTRRRLVVVAGLGVVAVLSLAAFTWLRGPDRHGEGQGPLAGYGIPGYEAMKVDPAAGATSWTYGVRLCLNSVDQPALLESVGPTTKVGSGFRFLGIGVREFTPTQTHTPIIGTDPWPPPTSVVPDPIQEVHGFIVSTPCTGAAAHDPYTELLIGLGLVSADGGGWQGIEVGYSVAGRHRVLVLDHDLLICGESVDCSGPPDE